VLALGVRAVRSNKINSTHVFVVKKLVHEKVVTYAFLGYNP